MTAATTATTATATPEKPAANAEAPAPNVLKQTLAPLTIDVAVPLGGYYLLHAGFGVGTVAALGISSVVRPSGPSRGSSSSGRRMAWRR